DVPPRPGTAGLARPGPGALGQGCARSGRGTAETARSGSVVLNRALAPPASAAAPRRHALGGRRVDSPRPAPRSPDSPATDPDRRDLPPRRAAAGRTPLPASPPCAAGDRGRAHHAARVGPGRRRRARHGALPALRGGPGSAGHLLVELVRRQSLLHQRVAPVAGGRGGAPAD